MRNNDNRLTKRAGFTLIELLVVIAIVAVMAAILFPVFAAVRERGRRTVCQSNLKQIAVAMQQYVQDNDGTYPPDSDWGYAPYSYSKSVEVFRCPDHHKAVTGQFSIDANVASTYPVDYSYNAPRLYVFLPKSRHGTQEALLATPSTIWLNVDACWRNVDGSLIDPNGDVYGRMVSRTSCGREFVGSTLHSDAGNYSYIDGHVKWLTPEEAGEVECLNGPLPAPFRD